MSAVLDYLVSPSGYASSFSSALSGQTFKTPDSSNIILDKFAFSVRSAINPGSAYTAYLYEWSGTDVTGSPLASSSGFLRSGTGQTPNSYIQEFDLPDVSLSPTKTYVFYLEAVSAAEVGYTQSNIYSNGNYIQGQIGSWNNYSFDSSFAAYFYSYAPPSTTSLAIPRGNFNEQTRIAINLSGTYGGTGTFDIANPQQSGNNDVKVGNYGTLTVSNNGDFTYSVDFDKVSPLKTGETGVDEFTITLTAANGTVTSSTYRVDIIGDTGSDNGGGGDDKPKNRSISIAGSRGSVSGKQGILIDGITENFEAGSTVKPYLRFPGQTSYTEGAARPTVNANGDFSWQRKTGKKTYVYFTSEDGSVTSNRVVIPAGEARLASSSLKAFDNDPIVGGSSNQHAGHSKGKRRRPVVPAASFGNRLGEDTNSSLLMATDSSDAGFYKQHDLVAASSGNW